MKKMEKRERVVEEEPQERGKQEEGKKKLVTLCDGMRVVFTMRAASRTAMNNAPKTNWHVGLSGDITHLSSVSNPLFYGFDPFSTIPCPPVLTLLFFPLKHGHFAALLLLCLLVYVLCLSTSCSIVYYLLCICFFLLFFGRALDICCPLPPPVSPPFTFTCAIFPVAG